MKCKHCGGEIKSGATFCEYCGSQITVEMKKEQEILNKAGCPKCGSSNVRFIEKHKARLKPKRERK